MDLIKLNIKGISFSQSQAGAYALLLEEEFGDRKLPIIIGNFEAQAIALALEKDLFPPRPLTHDLFANFARHFQINIQSVNIYKLEEGIFYSNIVCVDKDSDIFELDSRTSDAIAMAVRFNAPIYVLKSVMDKAGIEINMITEEDEEEHIESILQDIEDEIKEIVDSAIPEFEGLSKYELEQKLKEALEKEHYELAARLRDELNKR
ncbi:MAG: bifunctional nuclease family protein [Weeksellaceae bacterium]|nr:bifunctional nuclease family protein [Weeksellaceae bacterium]